MSARPKKAGDFDPNSQSPAGRVVNPTINIGAPGRPLRGGPAGAQKAHNPGQDGSAKLHGSYPKNAQKLRG